MLIHEVIHDSGLSRPLAARSFRSRAGLGGARAGVARGARRRRGGPGPRVARGARAPAFGYNLLNSCIFWTIRTERPRPGRDPGGPRRTRAAKSRVGPIRVKNTYYQQVRERIQ